MCMQGHCWYMYMYLCQYTMFYLTKIVDLFRSLSWDVSNHIVSNDDSNSVVVKTEMKFYKN